MNPLRVALICDMVPEQPGGTEMSTLRFAEGLRTRGHHVIIVGARNSKDAPVTECRGVPFYQSYSLPYPGTRGHYLLSFPRRKELKALFIRERIQIVHTMFPSYSSYVARSIARSLSLPVVSHIHVQPENISFFFPSFLRTAFVNRLILRYLAHFARSSNRIICPSEFGKRLYHESDPELPIEVVSNGIDLKRYARPSSAVNKPPLDAPRILYVGRLSKEKDPETLLRMLPHVLLKIPGARLSLVGVGPIHEELLQLTEELGIAKNVQFEGRISDADLLDAYHSSTVFILPSRVELEGMVVLEAMASGLPVIVANSPTSASPHFVDGNGFLFPPGDSGALASQVLQILLDPSLAKAMGIKSLDLAEKYSFEKSVGRLEEIYSSLLI